MREQILMAVLVSVLVLAGVMPVRGQDKEGEKEALALLRRAQALEKAGKVQEAIATGEKLLAKVKEVYGASGFEVGSVMSYLARLYHDTGRYEKAEPLYLRALKIDEDKRGKDHSDVATSLNNLARLYYATGRYEKAEPLYLRALKIKEDKLGKDHASVAASLNNLAALYQKMARYERAEPLYLRALKICEDKLGKDHPHVATSLNNLAGLYQDAGRYEKAEPLYQHALKIREARLGKDHPDVAASLNNLAGLYQDTGRYEKAEPLFQRAIKIYEDRLGKDHPRIATSLNNLAGLYQDTGRHEKAESLYLRALKIREDRLGKDHPDVASTLNHLGGLYLVTGRHEKAEPLYLRALKIDEDSMGKDHPDVASTLNNLGGLYLVTGRHEKAEALFLRALRIVEDKWGKNHPDVAASLNNLASLYAASEQPGKAAEMSDRARRGSRRHLFAVLPALSEPDRAAFFRNTGARASLEGALSLGLANKGNAKLAAQSASWLLNGKAPEQESLAASVLMSRQSSDPAVGKLSARLLTVRHQLARLTLSTPQPGQEKQRLAKIEELTTEEQDAAKELRQVGSKAAPPEWIEMSDLRKALPSDGVFIDIAHVRVFDAKAKPGKELWLPAHYVAWLTPAKGDVKVIDLGPADKIDAAIKRFRAAIAGSSAAIKGSGEEKAEKAIRVNLDALSKLILTPLLPHIGKSKRWLISPDGNLWLVPFETLTLKDGKYAIEDYHIHYFTTGRDLIPSVAPKVKVTAPLVLADPDFDLDATSARAEAKKLGLEADDEETRSVSGVLRLGQIRRLPGTAAEAKAIAPSLKTYAGTQPRLHTREQALEAVFKSVKNPRVVVLATHGFFLPDREKPKDDKTKVRWENPLLRSGLLLAGCNKPSKEGDDGVLTALEVVGTDLRGCELVVLSACETGVGDVQTGEGVSGLRQAFQLAGAKAVVSTLWQVPDKQSARLMTSFFDDLGKGKLSKADALRAAKLKLIEERRSDFAAAHPFYWAAFTLTGE